MTTEPQILPAAQPTQIAKTTTAVVDYTPDQIQLIKNTVAKSATDDEFKLFLYRSKSMGFDPLKPGQIYFIKYGNNPGSIVIGIDGFRSRAGRTGKHSGTKRGVIRDKNGKCIGAWAEVFRSDWREPAREEVSLTEYNTGKAQWAKMPETMIKKVAECAALRMAFPDDLGGVYSEEEMDQAREAEEQRQRQKERTAVHRPLPQSQKTNGQTSATAGNAQNARNTPPSSKPTGQSHVNNNPPYLRRLFAEANKFGFDDKGLSDFVKTKFPHIKSRRDLTELECIELVKLMEKAVAPGPNEPATEGTDFQGPYPFEK